LKKAGFQKVVSWTDQNQHFMVCFASFAWGLSYH
jgi:uncharacterized SAM-dependent methyltransferase